MSKFFTAGCDEIFDGEDTYEMMLNSDTDIGDNEKIYTISNTGNNNTYRISGYVHIVLDDGTEQMFVALSSNNVQDRRVLTEPPFVYRRMNYISLNQRFKYFNITDSIGAELPDEVFNVFNHFITGKLVEITRTDYNNNDGAPQSVIRVIVREMNMGGDNKIFKTCLVEAKGCQIENFTVDKNSIVLNSGSSRAGVTMCISSSADILVRSKLTNKVIQSKNISIRYYPHKPILEKIIDRGRIYIRIINPVDYNPRCHGNIYFNGETASPYPFKIITRDKNYVDIDIPREAGSYTAQILSNMHYEETGMVYANGELSDPLIIEEENLTAILSFNEYTGIISCIVDDINKVTAFILEKYDGRMWSTVGTNNSGEFKISESGTYRITISTTSSFFKFTVSPTSITVKTTLDTPVAYSDPAFPSQLGFDEVENANIYDIYRVSEDGEDELVTSISTNNIVPRVMRKEKLFIIIPNDEVKNV